MKLLVIVVICIFSDINCDKELIKFIDNFAGVQFDKVGKMQLIQEYAALTFSVNVNELQFNVDLLDSMFKQYVIEDRENSLVFRELWNEKEELMKLNEEFLEIQQYSPRVHRVKGRFIVPIESELSDNFRSLFNYFQTVLNSNEKMNTSELEIMLNELKSLVVQLRRAHGMIVNRTLDETVISLHNFEKGLYAVERRLQHHKLQMPFAELTEYVSRFKFKHESIGASLQLSMYIPLVSDDRIYDLYEIEQIPVMIPELNGSIETAFGYRYLAHSKNGDITLYENVEKCIKSDNYYCEAENPIYFATFNDCLINSFRNKVLDVKLCWNDIIFMSDDDFIFRPKQHGGWWFSLLSPVEFILNCTDNRKQDKFFIDGSGFILMDNQCYVQVADKLLLSRNYRHNNDNHELYVKYDYKLIEEIKKQSESIKFYGRLSTVSVLRQHITMETLLRQLNRTKTYIGALCIMLIIVIFAIGFYAVKIFNQKDTNLLKLSKTKISI